MRKKKMPLSEVLPGQTARVAEIRLEGALRRCDASQISAEADA